MRTPLMILLLLCMAFAGSAASLPLQNSSKSQNPQGCITREIPLLDCRFVLEARGNTRSPRCIFFVPHPNEKNGASAAGDLVKDWDSAALYVLRPSNLSDIEKAMARDKIPQNSPAGRYLYFSWKGRWYAIDPNRIYTPRGVAGELLVHESHRWMKAGERKNKEAVPAQVTRAVKSAAEKIIAALGIEKKSPSPVTIVAVHNNSPTAPGDLESFSFLWYKAGGPCEKEVERREGSPCLHEGDPARCDNLILVNRFEDFQYLRKDGRFNVLLMAATEEGREGDDGSLSVYCGSKGIRYVNVEAQHMNKSRVQNEDSRIYQRSMLQLVRKMVEEGENQ
ncbi:MAG: hypothetical protein RDV48_29965 [Candidatus Eremiobacteraeota bacterium]|nr:hypothetical protein [Candidatus Eremiobacteraeota bacterium]